MSCSLELNFTTKDEIKNVWKDFAVGKWYETDITKATKCLNELLKFANRINDERNDSGARRSIIERINGRGINLTPKINSTGSDTNESLGLIGEMVTENFFEDEHLVDKFHVKWRKYGTSKSRGIDLVIREKNSKTADKLVLVEAKHIHKPNPNPYSAIKNKVEEAIDEFEKERTLLNLAGIFSNISQTIASNRAYNKNSDDLEIQKKFLKEKIASEDYKLVITSCIDNQHCSESNFKSSMKSIESEKDIGNPSELVINLLCIKQLNNVTKAIIDGN